MRREDPPLDRPRHRDSSVAVLCRSDLVFGLHHEGSDGWRSMTLREFIVALSDLRAQHVPAETPVKVLVADGPPSAWGDPTIAFDEGQVRIAA